MPHITSLKRGSPWARYKQRERKLVLTADRNQHVEAQNRLAYRMALDRVHGALYDRLSPSMRRAYEIEKDRLGGLMKQSLAGIPSS